MKPAPTAAPACLMIDAGRIGPAQAGVPLTDRGFRFGMHLFETCAVVRGRWLFFQEHLDTLLKSASQAGYSTPPENLEVLRDLPGRLELQQGIVRVYWTAGDGGPAAPPGRGRLFILSEPAGLPAIPGELRLDRPACGVAAIGAGWKTGNYWQRCEILAGALQRGFGEALVTGPDGNVAGACVANIFAAMADGSLVTPPAGGATRPGVVRQWVLRRIRVAERAIHPAELRDANAILLTNSRIGLCRATALGNRPLGDFPGLAELAEAYVNDCNRK